MLLNSQYEYVNFWEVKPGHIVNLPAGPKRSIEFLVVKVDVSSTGMYVKYKLSGVDNNGNLKEISFMRGAGHVDERRKIRLIPKDEAGEEVE